LLVVAGVVMRSLTVQTALAAAVLAVCAQL
jgi:hypothetical protein